MVVSVSLRRRTGNSNKMITASFLLILFFNRNCVVSFVTPRASRKPRKFSRVMTPLFVSGGRSSWGRIRPPDHHIRILPRSARGSSRNFDFQTAVTRFVRESSPGKKQVVELHSQLHFATHDYFTFYNSPEFNCMHDRVLFELLLDESRLAENRAGNRILGANPDGSPVLMATPNDRVTADQYGLACQVDVVDYTQQKWVHADVTQQELARILRPAVGDSRPWQTVTAFAISLPGAEAASALFRPSTPSTSLTIPVATRLFSNSLLPGSGLAAFLRSLLWLSIPSPELGVMVLDWSSILPRPTGGVSQVALPVLGSILSGNIEEARKLVFGQMVVSSERSGGRDEVMVLKRDEHAIRVLKKAFDIDDCERVALLYGGMHCADLSRRLQSMGFMCSRTTWRTAWSVEVPSFGTSSRGGVMKAFAAAAEPDAVAVGLVILPLYLIIGGVDWIATIQDVAGSLEAQDFVDSFLGVFLYLFRHVLLYVSLSKFVVDWDGENRLFR